MTRPRRSGPPSGRPFDIVAVPAASIVNEGAPRSRRLALNLIKTALESGPTALQNVLLNGLELATE